MVMIPRPQVGGVMSGPATTVASAMPLIILLGYVELSKKINKKNKIKKSTIASVLVFDRT